MNKRGIAALFLVALVTFFALVSAEDSIDTEMQKITHYAEEFESGNIDYVQLLVYLSNAREQMNKKMGAYRYEGGLLRQEELKKILGEESEETKWAWFEKEEREQRLERELPVWRKVVFDGNKIQIRLEAFPSIIEKIDFKKVGGSDERESNNNFDEKELGNLEAIGEGRFLVYRLHFETEFKKEEQKFDFDSEISNMKELAEKYKSDPSRENGEELARKSVSSEKLFESFFRQNANKCEDIMLNLFGSENKRRIEKMIAWEFVFLEGEDYLAKGRIEMCDDCQWKWINFNSWIERRGPGGNRGESDWESMFDEFNGLAAENFESKMRELFEDYKAAAEKKDWQEVNKINSRIQTLNEAWNKKSNDIWKEVEEVFKQRRVNTNGEQREEYFWIKEEQERRKMEREIRDGNYEKRKAFYEDLFNEYEKKEYYYEQVGFEKRLIEEFKEFGEEICDNNLDDNKNELIDCSDEQCGGKICGYENMQIGEGNESREERRELYCIAGGCQVKEEIVEREEAVCGNNLCEANETLSCSQDCLNCTQFVPLNCSGRVIFSGSDERGCKLEPICLEGNLTCNTDADCTNPLCGESSCVEGQCIVSELNECREEDCTAGQEKVQNCGEGRQVVTEICTEGIWEETGVRCREGEVGNISEEVVDEPIVGEECIIKEDCGGENDVCSNGRCVTIPQRIEEETSEENFGETQRDLEEVEENEEGENVVEENPEENLIEEEAETSEESEGNEQTSSENEERNTAEENVDSVIETVSQVVLFPVRAISNLFVGLVGKEKTITGFSVEEGDPGNGGEGEATEGDGGDEEERDGNEHEEDSGEEGSQSEEGEGSENQGNGEEQGENQERREERQREDEGREQEHEERNRDDEERRREDDQRRDREREERCDEDCNRMCKDNLVRPCTETCIRKECGEEFECDVESVKNKCDISCSAEKDLKGCVDKCSGECKAGKKFELERPKEEKHKEEKGVFMIGGQCRTSKQKTEGFIYFGGWGEPFEEIQKYKQRYYSNGDSEWCKREFENLKRQREELEKGFNQEFASWFFEKYLANSAEDWESKVSGIYELYWKDVELSREMAYKMECVGIKEMPQFNLINFKYETDYGSVEFWEETKKVKLDKMEREVNIISPYMKIWVFPPKEFIKSEMKRAMEEHELPGPSEEEGGPTEREKEMIKQDEKFMKNLKNIADKYGGSVDGVLQIKDYTTNEIVFNVYVKINEDDILEMEPMPASEVPAEDVKAVIDFEKVFDLIYLQEKEMKGARIESPPWDRKGNDLIGKVKGVKNGIEMMLKVRGMLNSADVTPKSAEGDVKKLFNLFMKGMERGDRGEPPEGFGEEDEKTPWEEKGVVTGEVFRD